MEIGGKLGVLEMLAVCIFQCCWTSGHAFSAENATRKGTMVARHLGHGLYLGVVTWEAWGALALLLSLSCLKTDKCADVLCAC